MVTIDGLAAEPGLIHGFSTSALGSMRRTEAEMITPERRDFAGRLGLDGERLTIAGAVHGSAVARVDRPSGTLPGFDALVTDRPEVPLLITCADCYPVIVYDPDHRAVALAHAGWRGTADGVAASAVGALEREYLSRRAVLTAGIGPGICGRCYEVGEEVAARFDSEVVSPRSTPGKFLLDLAEANRRQLLAAGLEASRIHLSGVCTYETPELPSHRRQPDGTRFAALVAVR